MFCKKKPRFPVTVPPVAHARARFSDENPCGTTPVGKTVCRALIRRATTRHAYAFFVRTDASAPLRQFAQALLRVLPEESTAGRYEQLGEFWGVNIVELVVGQCDGMSSSVRYVELDDFVEAVVASLETAGEDGCWETWRRTVRGACDIPTFVLTALLEIDIKTGVLAVFPTVMDSFWLLSAPRSHGVVITRFHQALLVALAHIVDLGMWIHASVEAHASVTGVKRPVSSRDEEEAPPEDGDDLTFVDLVLSYAVREIRAVLPDVQPCAGTLRVFSRGFAPVNDALRNCNPSADVRSAVCHAKMVEDEGRLSVTLGISDFLDARTAYRASPVMDAMRAANISPSLFAKLDWAARTATTVIPTKVREEFAAGFDMFLLAGLSEPDDYGTPLLMYQRMTRAFVYGTPVEMAWVIRTLAVMLGEPPVVAILRIKVPPERAVEYLRRHPINLMLHLLGINLDDTARFPIKSLDVHNRNKLARAFLRLLSYDTPFSVQKHRQRSWERYVTTVGEAVETIGRMSAAKFRSVLAERAGSANFVPFLASCLTPCLAECAIAIEQAMDMIGCLDLPMCTGPARQHPGGFSATCLAFSTNSHAVRIGGWKPPVQEEPGPGVPYPLNTVYNTFMMFDCMFLGVDGGGLAMLHEHNMGALDAPPLVDMRFPMYAIHNEHPVPPIVEGEGLVVARGPVLFGVPRARHVDAAESARGAFAANMHASPLYAGDADVLGALICGVDPGWVPAMWARDGSIMDTRAASVMPADAPGAPHTQ